MSVCEYVSTFTQFSSYASKMVSDIRSRVCLYVAGFGRASSKEGSTAMLIGDMDLSKLMVYV